MTIEQAAELINVLTSLKDSIRYLGFILPILLLGLWFK